MPAMASGAAQEDIYNPLRFLRAAMKWCLQGAGVKHPRRGRGAVDGMEVLNERTLKLVIMNGLGFARDSPAQSPDCAPQSSTRDGATFAANTFEHRRLPLTRPCDVFDTATVAEAMAGCDDAPLLCGSTAPGCADPLPAVSHQCGRPAQRPRWARCQPRVQVRLHQQLVRRWVVGVDTWRPRRSPADFLRAVPVAAETGAVIRRTTQARLPSRGVPTNH